MRTLLTILAFLLLIAASLCLLFGGDTVMGVLGLAAASLTFRLLLVDAQAYFDVNRTCSEPARPPGSASLPDYSETSAR